MKFLIISLTLIAALFWFISSQPPNEVPLTFEIEKETWQLINEARQKEGITPTKWDNKLYSLSKVHTEKMAEQGDIFHSPETANYAENCWGGKGYYQYSGNEIAEEIVSSWLNSPLHRAWLLHEPLETTVVSIVIAPEGQYASWTFWKDEIKSVPELVARINKEWEKETDKNTPWVEWLYIKGYLKK